MSTKTYRNVMFLIADDWSRLAACYGNTAIKTPRIDEFAQKSVIFDYGFCTSPSCAVSRACILTGHHSHVHGQYGHCHGIQGFSTHQYMNSTPQVLREQGFATACIGKKHVEPHSVYPFEYEPKVNSRSAADLADCARTFLNDNQDRPFYLHVGFSDPHRAPGGFANHVGYRDVPEVVYGPDDVVVPPFLPDLPGVREDLADYYQAVSRFDYGIGLLLDVLEESGRADETLVMVTTDHAMPFPGAKASPFDSGHHCPFILYTPELSQGGIHNQALMNWLDIRPTVQDWCGVGVPSELPGRSLLPILETPEPEGWDEVTFSHCFHEVIDYNPYRVLRGRRYKYVQSLAAALQTPLPTDLFRSKTWTAIRENNTEMMGERGTQHMLIQPPEALYDIVNDPTESTNLIDDPNLQAVASEMRERLYAMRRETNDVWLEVDFQEGRIPFHPEG
ncbi:MAG: sulfatase [Chloroflexota bacterium]